MNIDLIGDACLLVYDTLKDDKDEISKRALKMIDEGDSEEIVKKGLQLAVIRLDVLNPSVAKSVREKAIGFAF